MQTGNMREATTTQNTSMGATKQCPREILVSFSFSRLLVPKFLDVMLGVESQELIFIRGAEGRADTGPDRVADRERGAKSNGMVLSPT